MDTFRVQAFDEHQGTNDHNLSRRSQILKRLVVDLAKLCCLNADFNVKEAAEAPSV